MLQLRLLEPGRYQTVCRHMLDPGEEPCSVTAERLRNTTTGAFEPYITVGTCLNMGEDYPCSGRVLLFRVARVDDPSNPWQATIVHARCVSNERLNALPHDRAARCLQEKNRLVKSYGAQCADLIT